MQDDNCATCTGNVGMLWKHIADDKHEMEMEKQIIKHVCSHDKDPSQCTMLVKTYFHKVSDAMFTNATAKMVCGGLGYCDMRR